MNDYIIKCLNDKVGIDDTLFFLGDFCMGGDVLNKTYELRSRINCETIHFILGNHDKTISQNRDKLIYDRIFTSINDVYLLSNKGRGYPSTFMSHYCHKIWPYSHKGTWHAWGHSHGTLAECGDELSLDVGVDTNEMQPYSLEDIRVIMSKRKWTPIDHHQERTN